MTQETLMKANSLNKKICDYQNALNCFEYTDHGGEIYDRTPRLVLDVDDLDEGRERIDVPMVLSEYLIGIIKQEIQKGLDDAKNQLAFL